MFMKFNQKKVYDDKIFKTFRKNKNKKEFVARRIRLSVMILFNVIRICDINIVNNLIYKLFINYILF